MGHASKHLPIGTPALVGFFGMHDFPFFKNRTVGGWEFWSKQHVTTSPSR